MGTFLNSPNTPKPVHTFYHDDSRSSRHTGHKSSLSGATMLDLTNGPGGSIAAAYEPSNNTRPRSSKSRRPSRAPSTKTQLRQTNRTLIEIVHNVQAELATQRQAMLDMQSRILQLESASYRNTIDFTPRDTSRAYQERCEIKDAEGASRVTQPWWDANHADQKEALESPCKTTDFWKSPTRFSGFNFNFDLLETIPKPDPSHAPEVHNVPRRRSSSSSTRRKSKLTLGPEDRGGDQQQHQHQQQPSSTTFGTPGNPRLGPRIRRASTPNLTAMYHNAVTDIREHVVEFDKIKVPVPPLLQSPPPRMSRSRLASAYSRDDDMTALPTIPPEPTPVVPEGMPRSHKGIRSLLVHGPFSRSAKADSWLAGERRSGSSMRR